MVSRKHFSMTKTSNLEVDGRQQQRTFCFASPYRIEDVFLLFFVHYSMNILTLQIPEDQQFFKYSNQPAWYHAIMSQ